MFCGMTAQHSPDSDAPSAGVSAAPIQIPPSLGRSGGYLLYRSFVAMQSTLVPALAEHRHPRDFSVLGHLLSVGPTSQQDLATRLEVNRSVMVHVIDGLEQAGLVIRERNPADRRSYAVTPTALGAQSFADVQPLLLAADARFAARLTMAERQR